MKKLALFAMLLALAIPAMPAQTNAAWTLLGSVTFNDPWQQSVIVLPPNAGPLGALRFEVKGADLEVGSIRILYGNGQTDELQVRDVFKGGSSSRAIPLQGGARQVRQVTVIYRAHGPTRFNILGDVAPPAPPPQWAELGCKSVGFLVDRDVINVGRAAGTFTSIRFRVAGAPVEFLDVTVIYGNGQPDTLKVRQIVPPGAVTKPFDLSGKGRGLDRIMLLYRSRPSFTGQARVCADGLMRP
jgi:hypothetical protein